MSTSKKCCEVCGIAQPIENFSKCDHDKYRRRVCRKCIQEKKKLRESGEGYVPVPRIKEYNNYTLTLQNMIRTRHLMKY